MRGVLVVHHGGEQFKDRGVHDSGTARAWTIGQSGNGDVKEEP
jgi:hypothetical protein